jgi:alpha-ketoglutarate-dependent taurine dioxygenase
MFEDSNFTIKLKTLTPFGLGVFSDKPLKMPQIDLHVLKQWIYEHKFIVFRGFQPLSKSQFHNYAQSLGELLQWEFGPVMEMKVDINKQNYLFRNSKVPFHWDGAFYKVPSILLFNCIEAPFDGSGGETLFVDTEKLFESAGKKEQRIWRTINIAYETEKLAHYGGKISKHLVAQHPDTGKTIMRFAEPVSEDYLNPLKVTVEDTTEEESHAFIAELSSKLYAPELCYSHTWQANDLLIADNYALIHGRNAFNDLSPRHLRRIQLLNLY